MIVTTALLADYVTTTHDGKLVAVGMFDRIMTAKFPCSHPTMGLALQMKFEPGEGFEHTVTVRFIDPDGGLVLPELNGDIRVPQTEEPNPEGGIQLALNMAGVVFPRPGPYRIDVLVDGQYRDSVELEVVQIAVPDQE